MENIQNDYENTLNAEFNYEKVENFADLLGNITLEEKLRLSGELCDSDSEPDFNCFENENREFDELYNLDQEDINTVKLDWAKFDADEHESIIRRLQNPKKLDSEELDIIKNAMAELSEIMEARAPPTYSKIPPMNVLFN